MELEKRVLAEIKPSPEEDARIHETVERLIERVMSTRAARNKAIEPYLVGSIAKGTHLKDPDADIFLLFDPSVPREELERVGLAIGREAIGGREHYAEHPYIKGEFMGLRTDIVPAYRITDSSKKMTAVDRTPFHTEYVKANLKPQLRDEVRLLKAFMKGVGTYGADAKTMGFSGYLCELLIIKSGGFRPLLEEAASWKPHMCFDIGTKTQKKFDAPMTFIDPVDPNRNVASALSRNNLALFIAAARDYLAEPKWEFFFPTPIRILNRLELKKALEGRGEILAVTVPRPNLIDDILYPQLRKFEKNIVQHLSSAGFSFIDSSSHVAEKELVVTIEMETSVLPKAVLHRGPPVFVVDNSANFLAKWKSSPDAMSDPFIKDGIWHVFARRKHTNAVECLESALIDLDAGKDLNRLKELAEIHRPMLGKKAVIEAVSIYLDRRPPWKR